MPERNDGLQAVIAILTQPTKKSDRPKGPDSAAPDESTADISPLATRAVPEGPSITLKDLPKKEDDASNGRGNQ